MGSDSEKEEVSPHFSAGEGNLTRKITQSSQRVKLKTAYIQFINIFLRPDR